MSFKQRTNAMSCRASYPSSYAKKSQPGMLNNPTPRSTFAKSMPRNSTMNNFKNSGYQQNGENPSLKLQPISLKHNCNPNTFPPDYQQMVDNNLLFNDCNNSIYSQKLNNSGWNRNNFNQIARPAESMGNNFIQPEPCSNIRNQNNLNTSLQNRHHSSLSQQEIYNFNQADMNYAAPKANMSMFNSSQQMNPQCYQNQKPFNQPYSPVNQTFGLPYVRPAVPNTSSCIPPSNNSKRFVVKQEAPIITKSQTNFGDFKMEKKENESLRFLTASIQSLKNWTQYSQRLPLLFEVFGMVSSAVTDADGDAKVFHLKDEQDALKCIFYEIDRNLSGVVRGQWCRCVGKWSPHSECFQVISVRPMIEEEKKVYKLKINASDKAMRLWRSKHNEF